MNYEPPDIDEMDNLQQYWLKVTMKNGEKWRIALGHILHCLAHDSTHAHFKMMKMRVEGEKFKQVYDGFYRAIFEDNNLLLSSVKRLKWSELEGHAIPIENGDSELLWADAVVEIKED